MYTNNAHLCVRINIRDRRWMLSLCESQFCRQWRWLRHNSACVGLPSEKHQRASIVDSGACGRHSRPSSSGRQAPHLYSARSLGIQSTTATRPGPPRLTSGDHGARCQESCMPACRRRVYNDESDQRTFNANRRQKQCRRRTALIDGDWTTLVRRGI